MVRVSYVSRSARELVVLVVQTRSRPCLRGSPAPDTRHSQVSAGGWAEIRGSTPSKGVLRLSLRTSILKCVAAAQLGMRLLFALAASASPRGYAPWNLTSRNSSASQ